MSSSQYNTISDMSHGSSYVQPIMGQQQMSTPNGRFTSPQATTTRDWGGRPPSQISNLSEIGMAFLLSVLYFLIRIVLIINSFTAAQRLFKLR